MCVVILSGQAPVKTLGPQAGVSPWWATLRTLSHVTVRRPQHCPHGPWEGTVEAGGWSHLSWPHALLFLLPFVVWAFH